LTLEGSAALAGPAAALFALAGPGGFSWDASAATVVIDRAWSDYLYVAPEGPLGSPLSYQFQQQHATETPGASNLTSTAARDGGALLVTFASRPVAIDASAAGRTTVQATHDPHLDEGPPADVGNASDVPDYSIHATVPGDFLNVTPSAGDYELRGNFTLRLYDVDYTLKSASGSEPHATGVVAPDEGAPASKQRAQTETITLTDAVLHLRAPTAVTILTTTPTVRLAGSIHLDDPSGPLDLPGLAPAGGSSYQGAATLDLSVGGGAVAIQAPAPLAAAGGPARAARAPPVAALAAAVVALASLALLAFAILRRPRRGDEMELALLAMEERRWGDALPHLDRLLHRDPEDASLLMDRALCLEETGRLHEARAGYEAALGQQPQNAELHYYYARVLARLRMTTAAMAHLTRALALDARLAELARAERAFRDFSDHPGFVGLVG
jgi:hypothetical protein